MKRFFTLFLVVLAIFFLFLFGMNLFDSRPAPRAPAPDSAVLAGHLEPGNGFFMIWGFAEPPEVDPLAPAYRGQLLELFDARTRNYLFRSRYSQWLGRLNAGYRRHWQGATIYFPQLPSEDICAYFVSRRSGIAERREQFAVPLQRYGRVLRAPVLTDFTPAGWEPPARSLLLATYTARLYVAARTLAALDGQWLPAAGDLLAAMPAGFKLIAGGRTLSANLLGKAMVELSLRSLASLLNRPDCPPAAARLVLENLPVRPAAAFGTAAVRAFNWVSFSAAIGRVKKDGIVDPFLLKDFFRRPAAFFALERFVAISGPRLFGAVHALAAFFLKENETTAMLRKYWEEVGALEEIPPWKWRLPPPLQRRSAGAPAGPFWWLRNPLGKMMVASAVPYNWPILQHYVYRSHELRVRYDLVRLLAAARLAAGAELKLSEAALRGQLAAGERDPFSGAPYRFSRELGMLYSIGPDAVDDNGREQPEVWRRSDIAVPIKFVISN
ncbi:MAG TPA: hypothetical protein VF451_06450 [Acidobacteriota bacterium]